jgi:hypothetical protein
MMRLQRALKLGAIRQSSQQRSDEEIHMSRKTTPSPKGNYEVGYGKPPKAGRFKKGQSGNPRGRQKGARNLNTIARDLMDEKIPVRKDGETRMVSVLEALLLKARNEALKGGQKEIERLIKMLGRSFGETLDPPAPDAPTKVIWEFVESDGEGGPKLSRKQWEELVEKEKKAKAEDDDDPLDR